MTTSYTPTSYTSTSDRYNVLAIVGFVGSFFVAIVGIVLGFIALSQIKRTGEKGRGLALAAVIIGFVAIIAYVIVIIGFVVVAATAPPQGS